jgi:DNA-binding PucR family transcriptional regulator
MFLERTLGKLLNYENKKKMEFLHTLEVILLSDNLKEAADRLEIHYQTLMFRKKRLEKILGLSFDDFSARMAILTAIYLFKLKRN